MEDLPGPYGPRLAEKFGYVVKNNHDIEELRKIAVDEDSILKWCPVTNVDCERSFSRYKKVLRDDRHSLNRDTISQIMITKCYYNRTSAEDFEKKKQLELVKQQAKASKLK